MKNNTERIPLTIIIITDRNDQRFINALKSAQIAKTVIVVDNNSDNNWKKLNQEYDFKLVSHEKKISNFATIRNQTLDQVKSEWVLFLDSDESLGNTIKELTVNQNKIKQVINDNLYDGVTVNREDIFLGKSLKYGETGNCRLTRMFKKNNGKFVGNVHEVAVITGKFGASDITISHFSHPNITSFFQKVTNYAKMAAKNEKTTKLENIFKMIIFPIAKFICNYILKLGFLDGYRGFIYALIMSLHSFFVRVFYFEKYFQENNNEPQI